VRDCWGEKGNVVTTISEVLTTTTLSLNRHRGVVLPEARVIVILVPVALFTLYWFVLRRRQG
jgi:hypothetical protein